GPFLKRRQTLDTRSLAVWLLIGGVAIHYTHGAPFTPFDLPVALATVVNGQAPSGSLVVVGEFAGAETEHGYVLRNGTFTTIDFPGSLFSQAFAINVNGVIVGDYAADNGTGNGNTQHGYVLASGTFTSIDFPGAAFTTARGINSQGDIVG